jgi:hypothetical protein
MKNYKKTLIMYNQLIKKIREKDDWVFVQSQALFNFILLQEKEKLKKNGPGVYKSIRKKIIKIVLFVGWIILAQISLITLIRCRLKKIKIAHFMIDIKNSRGIYDARSDWINNYIPPMNSLNFFHTASPWRSLKNLRGKSNPFFYESLYKIGDLFVKSKEIIINFEDKEINKFYIKKLQESQKKQSLYLKVLKWSKIKNFIFIDDSRNTGELRLVCRDLNVQTTAYMHARFNEFHVALFKIPFDNYLVWSPYFMRMLIKNSQEYLSKKIYVTGHPRIDKPIRIKEFEKSKKIKLLWVGESNIDNDEIYPYINNILKDQQISIMFRGKPGEKNNLSKYLFDNNIEQDYKGNLIDSMQLNNIQIIIGTHSTALMECWLLGVPSVIIKCSNDYGCHLWEDKISKLCDNPFDICNIIHNEVIISVKERDLNRKKIWGNEDGIFDHEFLNNYFTKITLDSK